MHHRTIRTRGLRPIRLRFAYAATVAAFAVALAGCSASTASPKEPGGAVGGELVVASVNTPASFDPHTETVQGSRSNWFLVFDRLTTLDGTMHVKPMLATDWTLADDATSLTLELRQGVEFHDGTPFDAEAVKANFDRIKSLDGSIAYNHLAAVESLDVLDDYQVRYNLGSPYSGLDAILAGPAGAMISPKVIASGASIEQDPGLAGTGPYLVDEFVPSESVVFVPAEGPNWDPTAGKLDRLEMRLVPDQRTRMSALQAGEVDIAYVEPTDATAILEAQRMGESGEFKHYKSATGVVLAVMLRQPLVTDIRVRQAIAHATDRDSIAEDLLQGTCRATAQLPLPGSVGFDPDFEDPYPYNPSKATKLLKEAGLGDSFELDMLAVSGRQIIAEALQQQYVDSNIAATITPLTALEARTQYRSDEAQSWQYNMVPDLTPVATMNNVVLSTGATGMGGSSDELRELTDAVASEGDEAKRNELSKELWKALADNVNFVPICGIDAHWLATPEVADFEGSPVAYAQYQVDLRSISRAG